MNDRQILRELAAQYQEAAASDRNLAGIHLHKAVNDLKPVRPILLIDEIPWHEMNINDELTLRCEDPFHRQMEDFFRRRLFQWRRFPGDMILEPYYRVQKIISSTGIGLGRLAKDESAYSGAQSHVFVDQLNEESDLEKLHFETITYHEEETKAQFARVADLIGDVLPVRISGEATGYGLGCKTWDDIVNLRGLDNLFYDLADRPEFIHATVDRLTTIFLDRVRQYDELNLFDGDAYYCHCASALTNDLHPTGDHVHPQDVWGRGLAQILASVSPAMHDEFDIQYMIRAMEPFGLVYYGCCEPLDRKIDILRKIPRLRKICISPWANADMAAEAIGKEYVMCTKPNPALLATNSLDEDNARADVRHLLETARKNGCPQEILMKDITTVNRHPENLIRWTEIAAEEIARL